MNEHKIFTTSVRLVVMLIVGLNYILKDLQLAVVVGFEIYALIVWVEQLFQSDRR